MKVSEKLALGALASGSIVVVDFDDSVNDSTFLLSLEAVWSIQDKTPDQGSIAFGVAHSDYSSTEIGEWFSATGAWDMGDLVAREFNARKIRQIGSFAGALAQETINNGLAVKTPLKFMIEEAQTLQVWAINEDASPLTTGAVISCNGKVWAKRG